MSIRVCRKCGGLFATKHLETFTGTPCSCPWRVAMESVEASAIKPRTCSCRGAECCDICDAPPMDTILESPGGELPAARVLQKTRQALRDVITAAQVCLDNAHWEVKYGSGELNDAMRHARMILSSHSNAEQPVAGGPNYPRLSGDAITDRKRQNAAAPPVSEDSSSPAANPVWDWMSAEVEAHRKTCPCRRCQEWRDRQVPSPAVEDTGEVEPSEFSNHPFPRKFDSNCLCSECQKVRKEYARDIEGQTLPTAKGSTP